jgi:prepilin-type N-terminal cleavage/methylation domain-containing protein
MILLDIKLGGSLNRKNYINAKKSLKANQIKRLVFGFSLLELSIVLMILSVVTGGGIVLFSQLSTRSKIEETKTRMKAIIEAVDDYYDKNASSPTLPTTMPITTNISSTDFGKIGTHNSGICNATENSGMVPVYALRLPPEYAFDAWGNRIRYFCKIGAGATDYLTIENFAGTASFSEATNRKPVVALISAGPNQKVAFIGRKGAQKANLSTDPAKDQEIENMVSASPTNTTITSSPPNGGYDDITYFITLQQITANDGAVPPQHYFESN